MLLGRENEYDDIREGKGREGKGKSHNYHPIATNTTRKSPKSNKCSGCWFIPSPFPTLRLKGREGKEKKGRE